MPYRFSALLQQDLSPVLGADSLEALPEAAAAAETTSTGTPAAAPAPESNGGGLFGAGGMGMMLVWGALIVGMYFLMMRPQRKREKQMKELQESIRVGDQVVTNSGMFGKITDVGEDCFVIEFGTNRGVRIPVRKTDVQGIKEPKLTPPPVTTDGK